MSKSFVVGTAGTASSGTFVGSYSGQQYVYTIFNTFPTGNPNVNGTRSVFIDSVALSGAISAGNGYSVDYRADNGGTLYIFYNTGGGSGSLNFTRYLNNGGSVGSSTGDTWSGGGLLATINWSTYAGAPASLTATRTGRSVALHLTASTDDGGSTITSYGAQNSSNGGSSWLSSQDISSGNATFNSLTPGTTYTFRVYANNAHNSGAARSTTVAIPALPTAPTLSATTNATAVTLNLGTSTSVDPVTYFAQMSSDGGTTWQTAVTVTGSTYTYSGLTPGSTYFFRVYAESAVGDSTFTTSAGVAIATVPTAPASIATARSGRNVTVTVGATTNDGGDPVLGYYVQNSSDGGTTWSAAVQTTGTGGGSTTFTGLSTGKTYIFRTYVTNDIGSSTFRTSSGVFISGYGKRYWQTAVTGGSATGGVVTYTATAHGFSVGDVVDITGVTPSGFNLAQQTITASTANTFSVANAVAPGAYTSGGQVSGFALVTSGNRWDGTQWVPITTSQKVASGTTFTNFN